MRSKVNITLLLALIIFTISVGYLIYNNSNCQRIDCLQIKNKSKYSVKEIYEESKYIFRALYKNGNMLLKVELRPDYSLENAKQAIDVEKDMMNGQFADAAAPYPGEISDVISCSSEYKPVYSEKNQNGITVANFSGYVNDRLVFGSCVKDQTVYRDTLVMFYCAKQKKFYQLEIIIPTKDYSFKSKDYMETLNSLGCNP